MKKIIVSLTVVLVVSISFSQSYVQKYAWQNGVVDTAEVKLRHRIDYCIMAQCAKTLRDQIDSTDYSNNTEFTTPNLIEFCRRGVLGRMYQYLLPGFLESSLVENNGESITDTQLNTVFTNIAWYIIKLIGEGSL